MSLLYPRLPASVADELFRHVGELTPSLSHPGQVFTAVGGRRVHEQELQAVAESLRDAAFEFGFPHRAPIGRERDEFDRASAEIAARTLDLTWSEATAGAMWSFVALVLLPDLTRWRFGCDNVERWIASDLTRHTWARAWWRGTIFADRLDLLEFLSESDLNQILERRAIGGDRRLAVAFADAQRASNLTPRNRRAVVRAGAALLRRQLAFVDPRALDELGLVALCQEQVRVAIRATDPSPPT